MGEHSPKTQCTTRTRLIETAGEVFAEKGLHGAIIREITRRAGTNIASVNYHFRDKFELYTVALKTAHEHIIDAAMNTPLSADTPEGRIRQLLSAVISASLDPARPQWQTRLLGRELFQPTEALDVLDELMRPTAKKLWTAVEEIRPDFSEQQILLTVADVMASCMFHVYHAHILRRMFPAIAKPELPTLIDHIVDSVLASLNRVPGTSPQP